MNPTSLFEILRKKKVLNASGIYSSGSSAAAGTEVAVRGLALGAHATDAEQFSLAQHNTFIGHLTRRVTIGGLDLSGRIFGVTSATPVGLESPSVDGFEVSLQKAEEIECEGPGYLYSGTGMIVTGDQPGKSLSFKDGLLRVSQTGEVVNYFMTANNLTPMTAGNLRIRAVAVG